MPKKAQELLYAVVGAGDLAAEKVREARKLADRKTTEKAYKDLVKRGQKLSTKVRNSGPSKTAMARTKTARAQVKTAATSVTKAVKSNTDATTSATSTAVKAS